MSLGHNDPRLANSTTGIYLTRTFNIEPRETNRFMPGVNKTKTYSERLRMGIDCDEVYPGIIIGKQCYTRQRRLERHDTSFNTLCVQIDQLLVLALIMMRCTQKSLVRYEILNLFYLFQQCSQYKTMRKIDP